MAIGQSNLLQALGWAVFNSLWQMAILWVAYQLIIFVFRINRSSQKSFLASSLLFIGFAWFTFTLVVGVATNTPGSSAYGELMSIGGNNELNNWLSTMLPVASILYLVLLVLPVLNFIRNYRYVQVIRRYGLSRADVQWRVFVQKIAGHMNIRKPVYVWMSDLVSSPVTIGYLKPVILLPLAAINHLDTRQIEAVLLHELSHIKRYDYFVNLLTKIIQTVLYFNPFVKAFSRIIETEREKSCDETVIQFEYEPHGYASALLVLEKAAHISRHSLAVAASDGRKGEFRKRIEWILGIHHKPSFSFTKLAGVMAGLLCFIALNAFLIVSKPVKTALSKDSFVFMASPYEFFADNYDKTTNANLVAENKKPAIENKPSETVIQEPDAVKEEDMDTENPSGTDEATAESDQRGFGASALTYVFNLQKIIPQLDAEKEKQVQQALTESKKVIQDIQWKEVEKGIADALTSIEKEKVKAEYDKAIAGIDWQKMGDNLRLAYDNIDWKKINGELNNALAEIKLDSIQQVYTMAFSEVSDLQKELVKLNQQGIPDTDINIKSLEIRKQTLQKAIDRVKATRPKKVVHL